MMMSALVHDRPSPNARSDGATLWVSWIRKFSRRGGGVRAGWQEWRKTLARLQRRAAMARGSRWPSGNPARAGRDRPANASRTEYALSALLRRAVEDHWLGRRQRFPD